MSGHKIYYSYTLKDTFFLYKLNFEEWGEDFKNTYELVNLGALKFSTLYQKHIFHCMGILCGISNVPFEIPNKIFYPYIEFERCVFCWEVRI